MIGHFVYLSPAIESYSKSYSNESAILKMSLYQGMMSFISAVSLLIFGIGFGSVLIFLGHLVKPQVQFKGEMPKKINLAKKRRRMIAING